MLGAGQKRPGILAEDGLSTDGDSIERRAMERIPHRNSLESAGRHPREFQSHADSRRSGRCKENFVQISRRQLGQFLGEFDRRDVSIAARTEGQFIHLIFDSVNHSPVGKSDLVDVVAVEVHETSALKILKIDAPATGQYVQTGS